MTRGRSASTLCNLVVMSLKTFVSPVYSCDAVLADTGRLFPDQQLNQMGARLSARRDIGAAMTHSDLTMVA